MDYGTILHQYYILDSTVSGVLFLYRIWYNVVYARESKEVDCLGKSKRIAALKTTATGYFGCISL